MFLIRVSGRGGSWFDSEPLPDNDKKTFSHWKRAGVALTEKGSDQSGARQGKQTGLSDLPAPGDVIPCYSVTVLDKLGRSENALSNL